MVSFPRDVDPALSDWLRSRREHGRYRFRDMREVDGRHARTGFWRVAAGSGVALLPHRFKKWPDAGTLVTRRPLDPRLTMPDTVVAWRTDDDTPLMPVIAAAGGSPASCAPIETDVVSVRLERIWTHVSIESGWLSRGPRLQRRPGFHEQEGSTC